MGTRERERDRELLIPVSTISENGVAKSSTPTATPATPSSHGHEAFLKVIRSWAGKKFMAGCVILFPLAITFYITWGFIHFIDGFFSPIYNQLGINVFFGKAFLLGSSFNLFGRCNCTFQLMLKRIGLNIRSKEIKTSDLNNDTGLGFATSITFIFLIAIFMSSWLGASVLTLAERFIKKMPLVSYIYSASKQISVAISPDKKSNAVKEVAIIKHPRMGQYMFGFVTSTVVLQKGVGEEELCCVYVPTNHLYLGDLFLISSKDILRSNLSIREGIEIVISGGMSVPKIFTTLYPLGNPTTRIVNFEASV